MNNVPKIKQTKNAEPNTENNFKEEDDVKNEDNPKNVYKPESEDTFEKVEILRGSCKIFKQKKLLKTVLGKASKKKTPTNLGFWLNLR